MTDEPTFCVDPIGAYPECLQPRTLADWVVTSADGTTNFVHGFPHACISLGLIVNRRPVLGVIYNPFLDQLYTARKGHGAHLSSPHSGVPALAAPRRLPLARPRALPSLGQALVGIEWGSDRSKEMVEKKGDSFKRLAGDPAEGVVGGRMAHSLRSYGSAALNYAMVAQGGLDLYWEIGCWCVRARVTVGREVHRPLTDVLDAAGHGTSARGRSSRRRRAGSSRARTARRWTTT